MLRPSASVIDWPIGARDRAGPLTGCLAGERAPTIILPRALLLQLWVPEALASKVSEHGLPYRQSLLRRSLTLVLTQPIRRLQVAKYDGIRAVYRGIIPASFYQLTSQGLRLGLFQTIEERGLTLDDGMEPSVSLSALSGAFCGALSAFVASPLFMVKTHMMIRSVSKIAVGHQRHYPVSSSPSGKGQTSLGADFISETSYASVWFTSRTQKIHERRVLLTRRRGVVRDTESLINWKACIE